MQTQRSAWHVTTCCFMSFLTLDLQENHKEYLQKGQQKLDSLKVSQSCQHVPLWVKVHEEHWAEFEPPCQLVPLSLILRVRKTFWTQCFTVTSSLQLFNLLSFSLESSAVENISSIYMFSINSEKDPPLTAHNHSHRTWNRLYLLRCRRCSL